jgi:hypothetical protein
MELLNDSVTTPKSLKKKHFADALGVTSNSERESELWECSIEVQMSLTTPQTISSSRRKKTSQCQASKRGFGQWKDM